MGANRIGSMTNRGVGINPNDIIRQHVNDRIENDFSSKSLEKQEAAASAAWRLAEMDKKSNVDKLSLEQQRTNKLAVSALTTVNFAITQNAYTPDAMMGPTLAQLRQRLNDLQNKESLPAEDSIALRRQIAQLAPDKQQIWPEFTREEIVWLTNEAEQKQRGLNKLLISVAGPVASPLAEAAALMQAPAGTVNDLLEVGMGLTAASGLSSTAAKGMRTPAFELMNKVVTQRGGNAPPNTEVQPLKVKGAHGSPDGMLDYEWYMLPTESSPVPTSPRSTKPSNHHNINLAPANNSVYKRGSYEVAQKELRESEERINDLSRMISELPLGDSEALGKAAIRGRVTKRLYDSLYLIEQFRVEMTHSDNTVQSPKTNAELKAYEARERLLAAQNIPTVKNGELVSRAEYKQSDQNIDYLKVEYDVAMQALWPKGLNENERAKAPVLFKSNKLNNVYHNINPTGGNTNCVNCSEALAKSIKGYKTSAMRDDASILYDVNTDILIKAHNIPPEQVVTKLSDVEELVREWGDGAIAIIGAKREKGTGHNFVVVNDAGTVRFLDRQADAERLSSKMDFTEIVVVRMDSPTQTRFNTIDNPADYNPLTTSVDYSPGR
jgi:hypothetical protein